MFMLQITLDCHNARQKLIYCLLPDPPLFSLQSNFNHKKYTFCIIKSLEHLKNLKIFCVPYLGLHLTMHVLKSQIHLVRQSLQVQATDIITLHAGQNQTGPSSTAFCVPQTQKEEAGSQKRHKEGEK
jgi:hypothetical protein